MLRATGCFPSPCLHDCVGEMAGGRGRVGGRTGARTCELLPAHGVRKAIRPRSSDQQGTGRGQRTDRHHLSLEAEPEKEEAEGGVRSDLRRIPTHAQIFLPRFFYGHHLYSYQNNEQHRKKKILYICNQSRIRNKLAESKRTKIKRINTLICNKQ